MPLTLNCWIEALWMMTLLRIKKLHLHHWRYHNNLQYQHLYHLNWSNEYKNHIYIQHQLRANEIQSSTTHAFPRTSFPGFQRHIEETNFPATTKTKIENLLVKAYSLCHEDVLRELKTIATSDVNSGTLFYDDDHITPWHSGMYLKYDWKSWCSRLLASHLLIV